VTPDDLLAHLRRRGVVLTAAGDALRVDAPAGVLTAALRQALVAHKAALLERLVCIDCGAPLPPAQALRCEPCVDRAWAATFGPVAPGGAPRG
jgi:hypothetical protein